VSDLAKLYALIALRDELDIDLELERRREANKRDFDRKVGDWE
jgi:hypothetical protein